MKTTKYTIQIPTVQFGLIAVEFEGAVQEAVRAHNELIDVYKQSQVPSEGLSQKDWNKALDSYLNGDPMDSNIYYALSPDQQRVIQEIKKSMKRLQAKNGEPELHI